MAELTFISLSRVFFLSWQVAIMIMVGCRSSSILSHYRGLFEKAKMRRGYFSRRDIFVSSYLNWQRVTSRSPVWAMSQHYGDNLMFDRGIQLTFHSFCEKKLQGMTPIPQSDEKGKEMISGSRYKSHLAERNEVWNKSFACKTALESLTYARQCLASNKPCCEQWAPRIYYALFVTVFIFRRNNGALNKEIGCPIGHPSKEPMRNKRHEKVSE